MLQFISWMHKRDSYIYIDIPLAKYYKYSQLKVPYHNIVMLYFIMFIQVGHTVTKSITFDQARFSATRPNPISSVKESLDEQTVS